jgi:hypothetical protein
MDSRGDLEFLNRLMQGAEQALNAFLARYGALFNALDAFKNARQALLQYLDNLKTRLMDGTQASQVAEEGMKLPAEFISTLRTALLAIALYREAWQVFEPQLASKISDSQAIRQIDAIGKALAAESAIATLTRYEDILVKSRTLMQATEAYLQEKQSKLLEARGAEVSALYGLLNPGADVGFLGMAHGTNQLKLHAHSYGVSIPAAPMLSQCQLNCFGLSVWIMRATTVSSPFGFIILDDPMQSMDDDHCEAFMASLVPHLLDNHQKQVVVLSHLQPIINRLRNLNISRSCRVFHFESYSINGPSLIEQSGLAKMLAETKSLAEGNESNRILAVDRLRVLVEQMVRELHLKCLETPPPSNYDTARPSQLLALFRQISGTTPKEHAGLDDTIDFADPAHHSEPGYIVPQRTNIQPHIDRLTTMLRKHGLIA